MVHIALSVKEARKGYTAQRTAISFPGNRGQRVPGARGRTDPGKQIALPVLFFGKQDVGASPWKLSGYLTLAGSRLTLTFDIVTAAKPESKVTLAHGSESAIWLSVSAAVQAGLPVGGN
ncbi:hypothetical protein EYF80_014432 [Liparis tanakae]|uniref:Uncharacterized protein n=1 Tax=Liparis tanakae TaxID=230148 RepID=A0A4Z2ID09_9TELE|nr:hypothetical protein EYF80_014432 [Liparis tanakae]